LFRKCDPNTCFSIKKIDSINKNRKTKVRVFLSFL
jgi:hypothetical protein